MAHRNPVGHADHFRSAVRQRVSDQLLSSMLRVASGGRPLDVVVRAEVDPPTHERASELAYSVAWFHDAESRWVKGTGHNPNRLVHWVRTEVVRVDVTGFSATLFPTEVTKSGGQDVSNDPTACPFPSEYEG